jgi:BspA type Leucine rich repeat region (6 copies)
MSTFQYDVNNNETTITGLTPYGIEAFADGIIVIPDLLGDYPVVAIGDFAFTKRLHQNYPTITSVRFPASLMRIGDNAFEGCALTSVDLQHCIQLTSTGFYAFYLCFSLTNVKLPNSLTTIDEGAFWNCLSLSSVNFPTSLISIGSDAFNNCLLLTTVNLSSCTLLTTIGYEAFCFCVVLSSVSFLTSLISIGDSAFYGCANLTSVTFEGPKPTLPTTNLFQGCSSDLTIHVHRNKGWEVLAETLYTTIPIVYLEQLRDISDIIVSTPEPVDLYVEAFNQSIRLAELASLLNIDPLSVDVSCTTVVPMSLDGFRSVFQFSIEDIATLDGSDNITDLHFYINDASLSSIEMTVDASSIAYPGQNIIRTTDLTSTHGGKPITTFDYKTGGTLPESQMNVASDFTRYLATSIFGTPAGVDLFYNEQAIITDITQQFHDAWVLSDVSNVLLPISRGHGNPTDAHLQHDASYGYYMDNSEPATDAHPYNISQSLFNQLLDLAPARFSTHLPTGLLQDLQAHQPQALPFYTGDSISWVLSVSPAAGQESLVTGTTAIPTRTYRIKMVLN